MQYKVELSGVNTAKLPVLKHEETQTLLREYRNGNTEAREKLIAGNQRFPRLSVALAAFSKKKLGFFMFEYRQFRGVYAAYFNFILHESTSDMKVVFPKDKFLIRKKIFENIYQKMLDIFNEY